MTRAPSMFHLIGEQPEQRPYFETGGVGRSHEFYTGGIVSPQSFRNPKNVIHIDRVYVPSLQPAIVPAEVVLTYPQAGEELIMRDGLWLY